MYNFVILFLFKKVKYFFTTIYEANSNRNNAKNTIPKLTVRKKFLNIIDTTNVAILVGIYKLSKLKFNIALFSTIFTNISGVNKALITDTGIKDKNKTVLSLNFLLPNIKNGVCLVA